MPEAHLWIKPTLVPLGFPETGKKDRQGKVKGQEVGRLRALLQLCALPVSLGSLLISSQCRCGLTGKAWGRVGFAHPGMRKQPEHKRIRKEAASLIGKGQAGNSIQCPEKGIWT